MTLQRGPMAVVQDVEARAAAEYSLMRADESQVVADALALMGSVVRAVLTHPDAVLQHHIEEHHGGRVTRAEIQEALASLTAKVSLEAGLAESLRERAANLQAPQPNPYTNNGDTL